MDSWLSGFQTALATALVARGEWGMAALACASAICFGALALRRYVRRSSGEVEK